MKKKKKREKTDKGRRKRGRTEQMTFRRDSTELAIEGESNNRRGRGLRKEEREKGDMS